MDKFFHIVIEAMIVILYMHKAGYSIIDKLQTWIGGSDWFVLISKVECDHLGIFTLQHIRDKTSIKTNTTIASMLETKKKRMVRVRWSSVSGTQLDSSQERSFRGN